MDTVIRIAAVGLAAAVGALTIRKDNPAGAYLLALAAIASVAAAALGLFSPILELLGTLAEAANLSSELLGSLLKVLAISVTSRVAAESCRDAGEKALGEAVELAGGAASLCASLPLLSAVFSFLQGFSV